MQRWFHAVVTHPDGVADGVASSAARSVMDVSPDHLESLITPSSKLRAADRLAVYANAYYSRLIECLGDVYPLTRRVVEEDAFADFAVDYLQTFPSKTYTLHSLGERFPDYLQTVRPERAEPGAPDWADFVIDLARLEWAIYVVFDGPGVEACPPFPADALLEVPPQRWPDLRLQPAPCLQLLKMSFPVNEFFSAARATPPPATPPIPEATESFLALSRRDFIVRRFSLSSLEYEVLSRLVAGQTLGVVLDDILSEKSARTSVAMEEQLRGWFGLWAREGFFIGFETQPDGLG